MATKVTVDERKTKTKYPYIGIDPKTMIVVWFYDKECGTVLDKGNSKQHLGAYHNDWAEEMFTPFHGTITLENE